MTAGAEPPPGARSPLSSLRAGPADRGADTECGARVPLDYAPAGAGALHCIAARSCSRANRRARGLSGPAGADRPPSAGAAASATVRLAGPRHLPPPPGERRSGHLAPPAASAAPAPAPPAPPGRDAAGGPLGARPSTASPGEPMRR